MTDINRIRQLAGLNEKQYLSEERLNLPVLRMFRDYHDIKIALEDMKEQFLWVRNELKAEEISAEEFGFEFSGKYPGIFWKGAKPSKSWIVDQLKKAGHYPLDESVNESINESSISKLRTNFEREYDVDDNGIITTPGKFEGETLLAPVIYKLVLSGSQDDILTDEGDHPIDVFIIDREMVQAFPELNLRNGDYVVYYDSDYGFGNIEILSKSDYTKLERKLSSVQESKSVNEAYEPEEKDWRRATDSIDGDDIRAALKMIKLIQDRNKLGRRAAAVAAIHGSKSQSFLVFRDALRRNGFSETEIRQIAATKAPAHLQKGEESDEIEVPSTFRKTGKIQTRTNGKGLWSEVAKDVTVRYVDATIYQWDDELTGEMRAYFPVSQWNTQKDGLIYTDEAWMRDFRRGLKSVGISDKAARDVDYSEQGAQGRDYVSMTIGNTLANEWMAKKFPFTVEDMR